MSKIIDENIFKTFVFDTYLCCCQEIPLKCFMCKKHGWTEDKFFEYYEIYQKCICDLSNDTLKIIFEKTGKIVIPKTEK